MKRGRWHHLWLPGLTALAGWVLHFSLAASHMARWLSLTAWCGG